MASTRISSRASARSAKTDLDGSLGRLLNLEKRILSHHASDVRCFVLSSSGGGGAASSSSSSQDGKVRPVLSVSSSKAPEFLCDQSSARLSCRATTSADGQASLALSLHAYNGKPLRPVSPDASEEEVMATVKELCRISSRMVPCPGFDESRWADVFRRVRKADFSALLAETRGEKVVYRARTCSVLFDPEETREKAGLQVEEKTLVCSECLDLFTDLDRKYCSGRHTGSQEDLLGGEKLEEVTSRDGGEADQAPGQTRGGRRTVRNKRFLGGDFVELPKAKAGNQERVENDENAPVIEVDDELVKEEEALEMFEGSDHYDDDFVEVRRSRRKRKASSRIRFLAHGERKRGRPPTVLNTPVACKECGKSFVLAKDYKLHCLSHTNTFPCEKEDCPKRFKTQEDLEIHMRRHRGEKPFQCEDCELGFKTKNELRTHRQKHTGLKPFPCPECPKSFARAQQREIHMAVHTGERSHLCAECGRSFASVSTLIDHRKRKHLEMRDHKCPECPKAFFARQDLESHRRTHTGDKPFQCTHCGKAFNRTHHLKRHIQSMHQGQTGGSSKDATTKKTRTEESLGHVIIGGSIIKLAAEGLEKGTVLLATEEEDRTVLLGDTEYLVDGQRYTTSVTSDGTTVLIPKATSEEQNKAVPISTLPGDAATSLIELSQAGSSSPGGGGGNQTVVVEIPGEHASDGNYILVTTDDGGDIAEDEGTRLVALSSLSEGRPGGGERKEQEKGAQKDEEEGLKTQKKSHTGKKQKAH